MSWDSENCKVQVAMTVCDDQSEGAGQVGPMRHLGIGGQLDCDWTGGPEK